MRKILFILIVLCCNRAGFGQTAKITGTVKDGETLSPLDLATVTVSEMDSTLIMYRLTDRNGNFSLEKLPLKKKMRISVTYTGYISFTTTVFFEQEKKDTLNVLLSPDLKDSQAIVITAIAPVRMNGDTLEINPAAFKTNKNAVVEELLNQVSGIVIWSDGTITVNGKKIQNLLVDGKPFLGSTDPRVATQNLPKTAIDKIQLYQEYDRTQIGRDSQPQDSLLTMNIKLKEGSKKGYFGKAGAGYGTTERFESDLSFQVYNKKSSAGIGGGFNNINKTIGNLQEMFQNNTYRNFNPNLYSVGRFGTNGINRNHSVGAVYSHSFIEAANSRQNNRVVVNYNTSGTDAFLTDLTLQNRTTLANPQFIREEGTQNSHNNRHEAGVNYVRTNSYNDNLSVNGTAGTSTDRSQSTRFTEVRDTANRLQNTNTVSTLQHRNSDNASLTMSYARNNDDNPLKNFNMQFTARVSDDKAERDAKTVFESITDPAKSTAFNRRYTSGNNSMSLSGTLDYGGFKRLLLGRYNLFGINLSFVQLFNYSSNAGKTLVSDYDSVGKFYVDNGALTNRNKRVTTEYTPAISFSKNFSRWAGAYSRNIYMQVRLLEELKTDRNESSIALRNLDRSFSFFRYDGNLGYNYFRRDKYQYNLNLNYNKNYDYPSVDQLYTIVDNINAYDTRNGNPTLRNRINHRLAVNGNINTQNPKSAYTFTGSFNASVNRSLNPVVDSVRNDPSGKRLSYLTNADKNSGFNFNSTLNLARRLKKNQVQLTYSAVYGTTRSPNYIDGLYNTGSTANISNQLSLQFSTRTVFIMTMSESFQLYTTKQTAAGLTSFKNRSNTTRLGLVLNYPANFSFSSTADRVDNSNLKKATVLWNAFATYRFMSQQAELKFAAMDLLKQYQNITNSVNAYGTSTRITNGLQQFFLVTLSYFPRHFGKKELKKPG